MESLSSGSLKRARTVGNGSPIPSCLVDGCTADLSISREYHRRHKVCEIHSKQSKVFIKGNEQRFCQQCSRFHSLVEFDEGKRSCRKRLEGHNRRRRKPPQLSSITVNPSRFFSISQGTRYINFGDPGANDSFAEAVKANDEPMIDDNPRTLSFNFRRTMAETVKGEELLAVSQGNSSIYRGSFYPETKSGSLIHECSDNKVFSTGFNRVVDSNRALSLLSSPPSQTREHNLGYSIRPALNSAVNSFISSLNCNTGAECETTRIPTLVSGGRAGNVRSQMLQAMPDSSSSTFAQLSDWL